MKRKIINVITAGIAGLTLFGQPAEQRPEVVKLAWNEEAPPEMEVVELQWDSGVQEEAIYNTALLEKVCMGEAGYEPFVGQVAVVTTILNRCDNWDQSVEDVVYSPHQYYTGWSGEINDSVKAAVAYAIEHRDLYPADMMYFRAGRYHGFGEPYVVIGSHYFSTEGRR